VALFTAALRVPPTVAALSARETHAVPTELRGERKGGRPTAQAQRITA
jgi:hypothetical protein